MRGNLKPSAGRGAAIRLILIGGRLLAVCLALAIVFITFRGCFASVSGGERIRDDFKPNLTPTVAEAERPKSMREQATEAFGNALKDGSSAAGHTAAGLQKTWTELGIADSANDWIWLHIREGNYETSRYHSGKGYESFLKCLKDVNVNLVDGSVYDYDYSRGEAVKRNARYPEVTEKQPSFDQTLLAAVINSDPSVNMYRLAMAKALIDQGADPDQQFGPNGETALMLAASKDDVAIVQFLSTHADVHKKDLNGTDAAHYTQSSTTKEFLK